MLTGKHLKEWRDQRSLTQQALADKLGVDQATISRIELDKLEPPRSASLLFNAIKDTIPATERAA